MMPLLVSTGPCNCETEAQAAPSLNKSNVEAALAAAGSLHITGARPWQAAFAHDS